MKLLVLLLLLPLFTLSEVVDKFSQCKKFFFRGNPPVFPVKPEVKLKNICQCVYGVNNEVIYTYATLYSTTHRIPFYSAYNFSLGKVRRHNQIGRCVLKNWYMEPQLDFDNTEDRCMRLGDKKHNKPLSNQAVNEDYKESGYDRGHLYPVSHTWTHVSMLSTFTLTNIAPQESSFNKEAWNKHEGKVAEKLKNCEEAYVVTGVVPQNNIKINNRVFVARYYWMATCCLQNGVYSSQGYYGPDEIINAKTGKKEQGVSKVTIDKLQNDLKTFYKSDNNIVIFPQIKDENKSNKRLKKIVNQCT